MTSRLFTAIADVNTSQSNPPIQASVGKHKNTHIEGSSTAHSIFYGTLVNIHEQGLFEHTCSWSISLPAEAFKASVNSLLPTENPDRYSILLCSLINTCSMH